ncbi:MAG: ribosome maturation factor RimP [Calditrichaeota bacterium]|nr:MAG: ribosome maturation factor RimP [Calditrichota bacterium]
MEEMTEKFRQLIQPIVEDHDVELVDLEVKGSRSNLLVRVFVDVPGGISVNQCAKLSRLIESAIELENLVPGRKYRLEVSSPGLDRPLRTQRDFLRNRGRWVQIRYTEAGEITKQLQGEIAEASETAVTLLTQDKTPVTLNYEQIQKALLQIRWS